MVGKAGVLGVGRGRTGGRVGEGGRAGTGAEGVEWVLVQTGRHQWSLLLHRLTIKTVLIHKKQVELALIKTVNYKCAADVTPA